MKKSKILSSLALLTLLSAVSIPVHLMTAHHVYASDDEDSDDEDGQDADNDGDSDDEDGQDTDNDEDSDDEDGQDADNNENSDDEDGDEGGQIAAHGRSAHGRAAHERSTSKKGDADQKELTKINHIVTGFERKNKVGSPNRHKKLPSLIALLKKEETAAQKAGDKKSQSAAGKAIAKYTKEEKSSAGHTAGHGGAASKKGDADQKELTKIEHIIHGFENKNKVGSPNRHKKLPSLIALLKKEAAIAQKEGDRKSQSAAGKAIAKYIKEEKAGGGKDKGKAKDKSKGDKDKKVKKDNPNKSKGKDKSKDTGKSKNK